MAIVPAGRGIEVLAVYLLFLALTTPTITLRVYCRAHIQKAFGADDYFAVLAWVLFVFHAAFAITGVYHGTGQHAWDILPQTELPIALKNWWLCEPLYVLSNMAIKASIALFLLRLSVRPAHKHIIWITFIVTELYSAFFFVLFIFQCRPSAYFWMRFTDGEGFCLDTSVIIAATYGYSAITCAGDLVFSILPVLLVWSLQMGRKEKAAVVIILAMGAIASVATIVRIPYIQALGNESDFLYATSDIAIWSCSETGLGITAACCAVLRPLFREVLASKRFLSPRAFSRGDTRTSRGQNTTDQTQNSRRSYKCNSSSGWEDEVTLQTLKTHGQMPGEGGKDFSTTSSAWYQEDSEIDTGADVGSGSLEDESIIVKYVRTTRDVTSY